GIDVDAADDQHVVGPALDPAHAHERPPAGALPRREARDVTGPVADERQRLLRQGREDEHALLAFGKRLARLLIDDLGQDMVPVDVRARALLDALARDAGPITSDRPKMFVLRTPRRS